MARLSVYAQFLVGVAFVLGLFTADEHKILEDLLDEREHPVLVEVAVPEISVLPADDGELATGLRGVGIDAAESQPREVIGAMAWARRS